MAGIRRALAALACALAGMASSPVLAAPAAPSGASRIAGDVRQFVDDVIATGDHEGRPFAVVDKRRARIHVFDASGRWRGSSAVLLGQARGDRSAPEVGEHAQEGQVPLAERTTPAGRFTAEPGRNLHGEHVVWVDYDAAFAIHRVRPGASHALRVARLATPYGDDKRLSWGCVVAPVKFYADVIANVLGRGRSVVYVLPENGRPGDLLAAARRTNTARLRLTGTDHPG
jgi:hypothetical protein